MTLPVIGCKCASIRLRIRHSRPMLMRVTADEGRTRGFVCLRLWQVLAEMSPAMWSVGVIEESETNKTPF